MTTYPDKTTAEQTLRWALDKNPGRWGNHCKTVARAARTIAKAAGMNADKLEVLGLLHDIGRYVGFVDFRHIAAGYDLMMEKGWTDAALACLTHSFPYQHIEAYNGKIDVGQDEYERFSELLKKVKYNDELRLIQLCDALCLPDRVTVVEVRLMEVALRYGVSDTSVPKWRAFLDIKKDFDRKCGQNLYQLFRDEISDSLFI